MPHALWNPEIFGSRDLKKHSIRLNKNNIRLSSFSSIMLQILLENHQTQQHLQKFDPNHWVSLAGFVETFQGLPWDWFSGWPHLQTLQLLGVGHLFWGEFCCHVFGLEDVDDPKSVGPRTLYSDDKHFEKRMTFNAFLGSPPGNFTNCLLDAYTKTKGLGRPVLQIAHARSFMETFTWNASLCSTHYVASGIPSMHLQHFDGNWHSSYRFLLTTSKLIFGWRLAA